MSAIQRMIDEMRRRGYASKTIKEYRGSLRRLAGYFGCCPSKLTLEQLRQYQVHLAQRNDISASYYSSTVTTSDLWRLIDEHLDSFQQGYDQRYQAKYGFWRPIVETKLRNLLTARRGRA